MKKILSLLLCFILLLQTGVFAFPDINGHWAEQYALYLYEKGIFNGDDNGNANLADNIRRSEFIALLMRSLYDEEVPKGEKVFNDVTDDKWYFDIISFAAKEGITSGAGDGNFYPDKNITREEIVLMLYRALGLKDGESAFFDVTKDYVYYKEISAAVESGIINGFDGNIFKPKFNATRGDATAMLCRVVAPEVFVDGYVKPDEEKPQEKPEISGKKLNLTWQQVYNKNVTTTGSYKMDGVQVISPMWFKVIEIKEQLPETYEYLLGGLPNYYLQDYGNMEYMAHAKKNGYEVWPMFKGDGTTSGHSKFLNNAEARENAIEMMRNLSKVYGFTGINLDFENMNVSDKDAYTQFVKEMSVMCKEEGLILSVDITKYLETGGTWSMCYDRKELAKYVDYVALMAYDEYGTWSKKGGSVASLPWTEECIKITLEEVPAEKLILCVPFYARIWREDNGVVIRTAAVGMESAMERVTNAGAEIVYDEKTGQDYAEWIEDGNTMKIWLENEKSMKKRLELIEKYNLAGVASWSRSFADPDIWGFIEENLR